MRALVWVLGACILAASYGVLHDQVTYWLSPEYYHHLKFRQFGIDPNLHNALGAGLVGVLATWWMGLVIGAPIALLCLFFRDRAKANRTFWLAAGLTVGISIAAGVWAYLASASLVEVRSAWAPWLGLEQNGGTTSDPTAIWFVRVGWMHNGAYMGGAVGLLLGLALTGVRLWRERRL